MLVKVSGNDLVQYPYSISDFRRDNPQTCFPKEITDVILRRYNVKRVTEKEPPTYDAITQVLVRDEQPSKVITGYIEADQAINPITSEPMPELIGNPIYSGEWEIGYTVEDKSREEAEASVRSHRNFLISETDWWASSDYTMTQAQSDYRVALRNVPQQEGFPYSVVWPTKPE